MTQPYKSLVVLQDDERDFLERATRAGDWSPYQVLRARRLLLADIEGPYRLTDEEICKTLGCSRKFDSEYERWYEQPNLCSLNP